MEMPDNNAEVELQKSYQILAARYNLGPNQFQELLSGLGDHKMFTITQNALVGNFEEADEIFLKYLEEAA